MERIPKKDIEKLYGKIVEERYLTIQGLGKLHFEIYDGFAYCPNFNGHEYTIKYPKLDFIEKSIEMQERIRKYLSLNKDEKISVIDVLQTLNEIDEDGTRIMYDPKTKKYKEKCLWKYATDE